MSDQPTPDTSSEDSQTTPTSDQDNSPVTTSSAADDLNGVIKTEIAGSSPAVRTKVIKHFVDKAVEENAMAIVKGVEKLRELNGDLKKIDRPDNITYGRDKKPMHETYSKDRLNQIEEATKKIDKLKKALNKALAPTADYEDLKNAIK